VAAKPPGSALPGDAPQPIEKAEETIPPLDNVPQVNKEWLGEALAQAEKRAKQRDEEALMILLLAME
jgi:hypothetical protein